MLTQANITAFCHWYQSFYEMEDESVVGAYASYGFDACMMDPSMLAIINALLFKSKSKYSLGVIPNLCRQ